MKGQNADIFQKIAYELDTREVNHTSNGSKATQITLEMMGQTKKQAKGCIRKIPTT